MAGVHTYWYYPSVASDIVGRDIFFVALDSHYPSWVVDRQKGLHFILQYFYEFWLICTSVDSFCRSYERSTGIRKQKEEKIFNFMLQVTFAICFDRSDSEFGQYFIFWSVNPESIRSASCCVELKACTVCGVMLGLGWGYLLDAWCLRVWKSERAPVSPLFLADGVLANVSESIAQGQRM